ncbi:MAG TPA: HRDC domain-containing protein [Candidatus Hydrogenedentes bacterium]|mgnify:CR=1 FL=1|nr:HRDC domain-containing protein [Candidatus Hydrogenedentota bacterium]
MQYKFFGIPAMGVEQAEAELNVFLRGHRVTAVQRELVREGGGAYWALCVEYIEGAGGAVPGKAGSRPRVDYKEVLSEADFAVYSRLRERRRELAEQEAVPVYAVCTNEQLAEMAKRRVSTPAGLQEIEGFGEAKTAKYAARFLDILSSAVETHDSGSTSETTKEPN